jgi:hypothetical protein
MPTNAKLKWSAGMVGITSIIVGVAWLAIWNRTVHAGSPDWLTNELRPPTAPRLMVLAGVLILIAMGLRWFAAKIAGKDTGPK